MPQSILVIGGTGHTGRHVVQKLKPRGYSARVLARDIESARKRFEQGDRGEGKVCREDVAEVCIQSLLVAESRRKTFELYNVPGESLQDWSSVFRALKADA